VFNETDHHQQVQLHSLASNFIRHRKLAALHQRLRPPTGRLQDRPCSSRLVRATMGTYSLLPRHYQHQVLMCHRWLWLHHHRMRWRKRHPTGYSGEVHSERNRRARLLRSESRRRFQPPREGGASWRQEPQGYWLRDGLELIVSDRA